jgi:hypothetical protein
MMAIPIPPAGLYFQSDQIDLVRAQVEKDAVLGLAWRWLQAEPGAVIGEVPAAVRGADPQPIVKPQLDAMEMTIEGALRYRFFNDLAAGQYAIEQLEGGFGHQMGANLLETLMLTLPAAQTCALMVPMLKDRSGVWLKTFRDFSRHLLSAEAGAGVVEQSWLVALRIVSGILLGDDALKADGVARYRALVDSQIHPEGYIKAAVEGRDGQTFLRQMLTVAGLTLAAEAAYQTGEDLRGYENRDVSLNTAATYLVYYYFYPDKWRWDSDLTEDQTAALFRQVGAFMEMVVAHRVPRGVEMLLDVQRPLFSASMGGLTTLTHYRPPVRKKGWFGR